MLKLTYVLGKSQESEIILAVMGGDGSLGCFIDDITKDPYIADNLGNLTFAPMPFGTGNDLSRSLGWGIYDKRYAKSLEVLVGYLMKAKEDRLALWQADIHAAYTQSY